MLLLSVRSLIITFDLETPSATVCCQETLRKSPASLPLEDALQGPLLLRRFESMFVSPRAKRNKRFKFSLTELSS